MVNPYAQQAPAGDLEKLPKFKFTNIGDVAQGVINRQSAWLDDSFNAGQQIRYIDLENDGEKFTVVIKSYNQKQAIGIALDKAGINGDHQPGDLFALKFTGDKPSGKGFPTKLYEAAIQRP